MFSVHELFAGVGGKTILKGINLELAPGKIHVLMGPNGSGKSTLVLTLMGHPRYQITQGRITLGGLDLTHRPAHERARLGLFVGFQYPPELDGVSTRQFLQLIARQKQERDPGPVPGANPDLVALLDQVNLPAETLERGLNQGFSGGEKKRLEALQMVLFQPKVALLDEPDSGVDVDSLRVIAAKIKEIAAGGASVLIITHYLRILQYLESDYSVLAMRDGRIVATGGPELAQAIDLEGYHILDQKGVNGIAELS